MSLDVSTITPDKVFDGGDLDCGSGLILLIREHMMQTPVDGILEMRSREPTVADDLPPWCRMAGHEYLGKVDGDGYTRYFVRRGNGQKAEEEALAKDKEEARKYEWRLRARSTGHLKSTIYARNFSFEMGQAASFEEKDANPSALEYLFGALAGSLTTAFASDCARENIEVDDIELTLTGTLNNVLAHMGLEDGDPSIERVECKCFVSTFDDEEKVRSVWQQTVARSPIVATLQKSVDLQLKLAIV
ncbi:TusA-related sulfurtransferase [Desulfopila aestuarii DSM 18488]|uniref:TusA-related sulfurtransferase n=1 Tax=Desulfopila aestuarii DSM 18488 TaxID=1121416 RepID=A0A1M7XVJ2_9BACT|nr:TusA-related sulfurtransferase [Desulfopila aestuarii DSM 18488]